MGGSTRAVAARQICNIEVLYLEKAICHFQGSKKSNKRFRCLTLQKILSHCIRLLNPLRLSRNTCVSRACNRMIHCLKIDGFLVRKKNTSKRPCQKMRTTSPQCLIHPRLVSTFRCSNCRRLGCSGEHPENQASSQQTNN